MLLWGQKAKTWPLADEWVENNYICIYNFIPPVLCLVFVFVVLNLLNLLHSLVLNGSRGSFSILILSAAQSKYSLLLLGHQNILTSSSSALNVTSPRFTG